MESHRLDPNLRLRLGRVSRAGANVLGAPQKFLNERPAYVAGAAYNQFYRWQVTLSLSVHWMA